MVEGTPGQEPPLRQVNFDQVAVVFYYHNNRVLPEARHRDLPLPDPTTRRVVILVDGIGSSSADLHVAELIEWIPVDTGFEVCVYSYAGIATRRYQPRDTVHTPFGRLVEQLDEYVSYYANAECIVLVGYSFGGLIIGEWLYSHRDEIIAGTRANVAGFAGSCLIASPIRLRTTMIYYEVTDPRTQDARDRISAILDGYTAEPEAVPVIAPMVVIRAKTDGLLDDRLYTFGDRPMDDRPVEIVLDEANHWSIPAERWLRAPLAEAIRDLCQAHLERLE
jgi:predicted alpha/beta-fold hydrolase